MLSKVPFIRPSLPTAEELHEDITAIMRNNWFSNFGPLEREFRSHLADYVGNNVAVATVNNATTGLLAALSALLPKGDNSRQVAIPSFTFAAGAHAISWLGYKPVWFDIDPKSLQPSISSFRDLVSTSQAIDAILLTNTFGIANEEIPAWEQIASELSVPLIIDSAAGFGSEYSSGERLGARGSCEVFSFHATKPFGIGEGGAVFSKDQQLIEKIIRFTNFGFDNPYGAIDIGFNGKLQEVNAAIGLRQLAEFDEKLTRRRNLVRRYRAAFESLPLTIPESLGSSSASFLPAVFHDQLSAEIALGALTAANVDARCYYAPPLHIQPAFTGHEPTVSLNNTTSASTRTVCMPILADMTDPEFSQVTASVLSSLKNNGTAKKF